MDNRALKIIKDMDDNAIGLDDTFQFKCRACGKCCKNRYDIMLTTRDLYNIAHTLGRTMKYTVDRYCDVYVGESSRVPIVRLKPGGADQSCPLMFNRRCIVHKAKPVVCALFPLGRVLKNVITENGSELPSEQQPVYFLQNVPCGTRDQTHTVREWLEEFGIPIEDEFYGLWNETNFILSDLFRGLEEKKASKSVLDILRDVAFSEVYMNYDTKLELMPQFRENTAKLRDVMAKIKTEAEACLREAKK